ncbi:MAG TPA: hypothetical protein VG961_03790 [Ignavibacteria bacterium]|nr:hypothetical protein [Ignavibacteria bacterium]
MNTDIISLLTVSGLVIYAINYLAGWLVHFKVLKLSKFMHTVLFAILLIVLLALILNLNFLSNKFLLYSASFIIILILPAGTKGGLYHIGVSSAGMLTYIFTMLNYQFFKLLN